MIFDKSGTVDKAMRASWEKKEMVSQTNGLDQKLAVCSDSVWHNLMLSAVAIKRRQYWRAYAELELARKWFGWQAESHRFNISIFKNTG